MLAFYRRSQLLLVGWGGGGIGLQGGSVLESVFPAPLTSCVEQGEGSEGEDGAVRR